ncbi:hypothetical protein BpHYR1_002230 [Brachionus plicatilis]|uniref:Uncharacterized protein n=1 Tax=Brachionus plicatilis TaxID=10195 RepID=A0A3M7SEG0_BRAPC|nr:hypothetical protein BpHYR1_002230 [Brachionus plicatilis]
MKENIKYGYVLASYFYAMLLFQISIDQNISVGNHALNYINNISPKKFSFDPRAHATPNMRFAYASHQAGLIAGLNEKKLS